MRPLILTSAAIADAALLWSISAWTSTIVFSYVPLNYAALVLFILLLPILVVALANSLKTRWLKWVIVATGVIMLIPAGVASMIFGVALMDAVVLGKDPSFEKIDEISVSTSKYCVYRTNGGATTDFGI